METFDPASAQTRVIKLRTAHGGVAYVLGVAHLSSASTQMVRTYIQQHKPDTVAVELCAARAQAMGIPAILAAAAQQGSQRTPVYIAYEHKQVFTGILPLLLLLELSHVNAAFDGLYEDTPYGGEQLMAVQEALKVGASLALIDRPMTVTLARARPELSLMDIFENLPSAFGCIELPPDYVAPPRLVAKLAWQACRKSYSAAADTLQEIMLHAGSADPLFMSSAPGRALTKWNTIVVDLIRSGTLQHVTRQRVQDIFQHAVQVTTSDPQLVARLPKAFTSERDMLLAHAIYTCPGETVVAVVGSGHVEAIAKHWGRVHSDDIAPLLQPPAWHTATAVVIPAAVALGSMYGLYRLGRRSKAVAGVALATVGVAGGAAWGIAAGAKSMHNRIRDALAHGRD